MSATKEAKKTDAAEAGSGPSENGEAIIRIVDVTPAKEKRTGVRVKLLNEMCATPKGKASPKSEKRVKILNNTESTKSPKRTATKTISPAGSAVKILNDKRTVSTTAKVSTTKLKPSPNKKKKMDHYVLQAIKSEGSKADSNTTTVTVDDDDTIDFIITENDEIEIVPEKATDDEFVVSGVDEESDEEEDDDNSVTLDKVKANKTAGGLTNDIKEIVEHVCGKCYKTFRRVKSLKKHLEFCRYDSGYHLRKADMLKNLEKIEKDAVVMEKKDICFCCSESYDTFHLGHINCPDCPKSFKTQTSYERHIFITHSEFNDYPCSICNAKLRSGALLKLHEEQHQSRGKPFACKICGKDFTRSYHLKRHQKYSSCSANENDTMSCKVCDRVFYRLDNLRAHLKQHLGTQVVKKPEYMCHVCKNCFYSLSTLNIHIRTHTGEKPFDCDLCEKKFSALVALKKHRRYHTGEKPYTCTVCSQSFAVKEVLNRHMKRHTGERPHKCNECGKSFIQATQLRTHSKTHLRPHACDQCTQKFKTEKQLERHTKEHSRLKRPSFGCTDCTRSFRTAALLKEHVDAGDHSPVKPTRTKRPAKVIERTDCAICDKNFDSSETLRKHIRNVHECDPDDIFGTEPASKRKAKKAKDVEEELEPEDTANTSAGSLISSKTDNNGVVVREFLVDEGDGSAQTILLENEVYTILPLEGESNSEAPAAATATKSKPVKPESKEKQEQVTSPVVKKEQRKSLAASLAAAIADNLEEPSSDDEFSGEVLTEEDIKLKENVAKLIDMLVDPQTLKKYNWPNSSEETVLCKVIENCGHDLAKGAENYAELGYGSRMREYCKLLFTVVIHNDSIKSLLNNFPIDDVIEYVLGDEDADGEEANEKNLSDNDISADANEEAEAVEA
ncbi:protein suppressor of hairy wing [Drosophila busckii]|uniref:protein suppressor of hairy wing n=1 Tax=Drosophila busckii TaxID=30019 RepID=UPI00083F280A|nr:protein suppressor of hairy wing [Drosophila busckii]